MFSNIWDFKQHSSLSDEALICEKIYGNLLKDFWGVLIVTS